ncbi:MULTISPECIES: surface lipoprotein assembly modifier [Rodentibacter]|uniref:surface lipoprotein assembly modifier n=1 Tax=Rodentibacter TaxID=1960084 RepID=UPI001CFD1B8A|nr:surface lipoprotein assembly modifier [Rodentibacter sp. JRC1]GJI55705.1 membrane protein [Rodentibacter sp. JRC1]
MLNKVTLAIMIGGFIPSVYANSISVPEHSFERDPIQTEVNPLSTVNANELKEAQLRNQSLPSVKSQEQSVIRYTGKQLRENPQILEKLFVDALIGQNKAVLPVYIQIYELTPNPDHSLIDWGNAILAKDKNVDKSVNLYRKLISHFPDNNFIRFQLAESLFINQEYEAAKDQFEKLRSSSVVMPQDIVVFDRYIEAINNRNKWNFSFGARFLNDPNLGNSADKGTTVTLPNGRVLSYDTEKESGKGLSLWFGVDKQWALSNGKYLITHLNTSSKYYWNNKKYNDVNAHFDFGMGYSTARFNIEFTPYIEQRWYGGGLNGSNSLKRYTKTFGSLLSGSYWITPTLKYSLFYNYGYEKYDKKLQSRLYDGVLHQITNSLMYFTSPRQYWNVSIDYINKDAKDKTNAYYRYGTRLTWGQEWPLGVSSSFTLGIAKRQYKDIFIFGNKQRNNEFSSSLSLWHKEFHYAGFTPRITWNYTKTDSNIPIYSYDKSQVFIEASRTF